MTTQFLTALAVFFTLNYYSEDIPDIQTETEEQVYQPVNNGTGIQSIFRNSNLEKTIIKGLKNLGGVTLPEDYETRLFTLSKGDQDTASLSDAELGELNEVFSTIKNHVIGLYRHSDEVDLELIKSADIEAVYIYSISHSATTLECLTWNDICQPDSTKYIEHRLKDITQLSNKYSVLDNYKNMFAFDLIMKKTIDEGFLYNYYSSSVMNLLDGVDFTKKWLIQERISDLVSLASITDEDTGLPALGYRALFVMTDPDKKNLYILSTGRRYTGDYNAEQLSNLLKTIPGKQITKLTGIGKRLHKKNQP
ncbi:hypothetical protein [Endozoicomonas sp. 8E]|uniref:hypothetical protein n=1 Tax=Endozoicomonas sp. 8E TaxID=3035692 RepID=UPI0029390ED9|nr:hypothetical protein [Endozoicomonas sp. 8E]WOG29433.1 hypothetical protein P6910_07230 [Endozoicomonas sp. 8E]